MRFYGWGKRLAAQKPGHAVEGRTPFPAIRLIMYWTHVRTSRALSVLAATKKPRMIKVPCSCSPRDVAVQAIWDQLGLEAILGQTWTYPEISFESWRLLINEVLQFVFSTGFWKAL